MRRLGVGLPRSRFYGVKQRGFCPDMVGIGGTLRRTPAGLLPHDGGGALRPPIRTPAWAKRVERGASNPGFRMELLADGSFWMRWLFLLC